MTPADQNEFSVFPGGPLFRLYGCIHLTGPALELPWRRVVVVVLFAWLPLLLLSIFAGNAWGGVREPFLFDADSQARLLVALPLLIGAEPFVHRRMCLAVAEFGKRGLVTDVGLPQFQAAVASARRLRDSTVAEIVLLLFVYSVGVGVIWRRGMALDIDSWYRQSRTGTAHLTAAGCWYGLVSLPLFQFILYRWYFRLAIWARFLWQVVRTGLDLVPTHPDRCAGTGFLGEFTCALVPLLLAHGAVFAGVAAAGIFFDGKSLPQYWPALILLAGLVLLIAWGPVLAFIPELVHVKRMGLRDYGVLAQHYVRGFERKWLQAGVSPGEPLLGSSDIQSLADLGNSYQIVAEMRVIPVSAEMTLRLGVVTLVPVAPLLFTMISARQLLALIFKELA